MHLSGNVVTYNVASRVALIVKLVSGHREVTNKCISKGDHLGWSLLHRRECRDQKAIPINCTVLTI